MFENHLSEKQFNFIQKKLLYILRLFFNHITKHAPYLSDSPEHIKITFTEDYETCKHCKGEHCKFRKDYEIGGVKYEKCNGTTFEFQNPKIENLTDYLALFKEFYPLSKR